MHLNYVTELLTSKRKSWKARKVKVKTSYSIFALEASPLEQIFVLNIKFEKENRQNPLIQS